MVELFSRSSNCSSPQVPYTPTISLPRRTTGWHWGATFLGNRTAALLSVRVHSTCHYEKLRVRETALSYTTSAPGGRRCPRAVLPPESASGMHIEIALTSLAPRRAEGQIMFTCVELQDDPGSREQKKARRVGRLEQRAFELAGGYTVAVEGTCAECEVSMCIVVRAIVQSVQ